MRIVALAGTLVGVLAGATAAQDHVAKGPLPEKEGFVVSGIVVGDDRTPIHLELARDVAAPLILHGVDWSFLTADVAPGESFRFTGVPPGRYRLWTQGRRVEEFAVFGDHTGHEFHALSKRIKGRVRPLFETKGERMTIEFRAENGTGETRFEVVPGAEFDVPLLSLGRQAVEVWWIQPDPQSWLQPHRWTWVDVTPETTRFDFDFVPACDVRLSVKSAGRPETFEGRVLDADLPPEAWFAFEAAAEGDANAGTRCWGWGPFGAAFGRPQPTVPLLNVTKGTHRFRVEAQGFEPFERTVEVGDGTTPFDVEMTPIPGTFVFAEGGYGTIFEVFARPAGGGGPWKSLLFGDNRTIPTHTDPDRPRELLAPGRWEFFATSGDLAPSRPQTFDLGAEHAEMKIDLPGLRGRTLTATLRTPSGVPLAGTEIHVFVNSDDGWRRLRAKAPIIDEKGAFTIQGLAPGAYRIAFDEGGRHVAGEFEVERRDVRKDFVFRRDR